MIIYLEQPTTTIRKNQQTRMLLRVMYITGRNFAESLYITWLMQRTCLRGSVFDDSFDFMRCNVKGVTLLELGAQL
jgi:hypothetical protein